mgnify:CR=1 FL=1
MELVSLDLLEYLQHFYLLMNQSQLSIDWHFRLLDFLVLQLFVQ